MAGTVLASTIKHDVSGAAPVIRDGAGTEIGQLCKAWASYNASSLTFRGSFNVSSVIIGSSSSSINYTLTNALIDANYCVNVSVAYTGSTWVIPTGYASSSSVVTIQTPIYNASAYALSPHNGMSVNR